jgi:hypothetical protein
MQLRDVFSKLRHTYKSIDLYVASAKYEEKWVNLLILVRFSNEEADSINKQIAGNNKLAQLAKGDLMRINRNAFPLEYLQELTSDLSKGALKMGEEIVHVVPANIMHNFDLSLQRSDLPKNMWGSFSSTRSKTSGMPHDLTSFYDSLIPELVPLGSSDIYAAIRNHFNLEYDSTRSSYDLSVEAPVYAKINNVELLGKKLVVKITYHKNLENLFLHYDQRYYFQRQNMPETKVYNPSMGIISQRGEFVDWEIELEELDIAQKSYENITCDLSLYIPQINSDRVSSESVHITKIIAEKRLLETNPLAKIFARFCSIDEFTKLLTNPTNINKGGFKLDISDNFERAVYWLFTLNGFQAIWLGDHEIMDEKKHASGSTDLLCYSSTEKALAVVSCKIKVPEPDDIDKIKNLAAKIGNDIKELGIKSVPIIVSSEPCDTIRETGAKNGVDIIDIHDVKKIMLKLYEIPPSPILLLRDLNIFTSRPNSFSMY